MEDPKIRFSQVKLAHFAIFYGFGVHCFENNSSCFMFLGHVILSTDGFSREDLEGWKWLASIPKFLGFLEMLAVQAVQHPMRRSSLSESSGRSRGWYVHESQSRSRAWNREKLGGCRSTPPFSRNWRTATGISSTLWGTSPVLEPKMIEHVFDFGTKALGDFN